MKILGKMIKAELLPIRDCEAGYAPVGSSGWSRFYRLFSLGIFCCVLFKKLRILEKKYFGFCQTGNPQFTCIMYFCTYRQLTCKNLKASEFSFLRKSTKKKSLVIRT